MSFNVDGLTAFLTANRAALEGLKIEYPRVSDEQHQKLLAIRAKLAE